MLEIKELNLLHIIYYFVYFSIRKVFDLILFENTKLSQIAVLHLKLLLCILKESFQNFMRLLSFMRYFFKAFESNWCLCDLYCMFIIWKIHATILLLFSNIYATNYTIFYVWSDYIETKLLKNTRKKKHCAKVYFL